MRHRVAFLALLLSIAAPALAGDPPPYSLPWQLRPAAIGTVLRWDSVVADYEDASGNSGRTLVSFLLLSYKVNDKLAPMIRVGYVDNDPPVGKDGNAYVNPAVGATYLIRPSDDWRVGLFLGLTIPVGQGAGNSPNPATSTAVKSGPLARSAMDNAMFSVNDATLFPGVDIAYVHGGFTFQGEVTLFELHRVHGDRVQVDDNKTNLTSGVHFGYFFGPHFSLGGEVRYQRWLTTPSFVEANEKLRDNLSVAAGPRFHFKVGKNVKMRPGIAYATGLDGPIDDLKYSIVQIDVPIYF
ncbi:MAG: hypothetical protein U0166_28705 [Acidobacteriota bacterium]